MLKAICYALTIGWITSSVVGAAVNATISGGGGTPITFTLPTSVSYTVTSNAVNEAFLFKGAAPNDPFFNSHPSVAGTITYSINGGPSHVINDINSGYVGGDIAATDLYFFGEPFSNLAPGDVVLLNAGYLTTATSIAAVAPPSGSFSTFVVADALRVSADGVTVPEPGTGLLVLLPLAAFVRRRNADRFQR